MPIWEYRYSLRIFFRLMAGASGRGAGRKGKNDMKNVEMAVEGNILIIKVDLTKDFGPSSSKKSIIIASTEGNVSVPNRQEKVGLNVYRTK
jgi:hypothetical protein